MVKTFKITYCYRTSYIKARPDIQNTVYERNKGLICTEFKKLKIISFLEADNLLGKIISLQHLFAINCILFFFEDIFGKWNTTFICSGEFSFLVSVL